MDKSRKKKPKKGAEDTALKTNEEKKSKEAPAVSGDDKPFDFGGLPNRDLKKNLGCG